MVGKEDLNMWREEEEERSVRSVLKEMRTGVNEQLRLAGSEAGC